MRRTIRQKSEEQALNILSSLCASSEYCSSDMEEKMKRWNMPEEARTRVLGQLISDGFIDDERYCRAFVHDKISYAKWGRRKLELALYRKGISKDVSNPILNTIPDETYIKILKPLINTKIKSVHANSIYERNQKLFRFAAGRGFTTDLIRKCIPEGDEMEVFPMDMEEETDDFTDHKDTTDRISNTFEAEEQEDRISDTFGEDDKIDRVSTTFGAQKPTTNKKKGT